MTSGKFLPCSSNQSLGPECDCHQQAVEEVDDTEALMGFWVSYRHVWLCVCSQEHGSSCGIAGQEPKLSLETKRRTANSGTLFLDGLNSILKLRGSKMLEPAFVELQEVSPKTFFHISLAFAKSHYSCVYSISFFRWPEDLFSSACQLINLSFRPFL